MYGDWDLEFFLLVMIYYGRYVCTGLGSGAGVKPRASCLVHAKQALYQWATSLACKDIKLDNLNNYHPMNT